MPVSLLNRLDHSIIAQHYSGHISRRDWQVWPYDDKIAILNATPSHASATDTKKDRGRQVKAEIRNEIDALVHWADETRGSGRRGSAKERNAASGVEVLGELEATSAATRQEPLLLQCQHVLVDGLEAEMQLGRKIPVGGAMTAQPRMFL